MTPDIRYHSLIAGEDYYDPLARTPTTMSDSLTYGAPMHIQNTGGNTIMKSDQLFQ